MAMDSCLEGRSLLERLRLVCVSCLVLDWVMVLVMGLTAVSPAQSSQRLECYEEHDYNWHTVVMATVVISGLVALYGAVVHFRLACAAKNDDSQLTAVAQFARVLFIWTILAVILEAIAYWNTPEACLTPAERVAQGRHDPNHGQGQGGAEQEAAPAAEQPTTVWHATQMFIWIGWISCCAGASILARRLVPLPKERQEGPPATPGSALPHDSPNSAQIVGMPMQEFAAGAPVAGAPTGLGTAEPSAKGFDGQAVVAQGMPVGGGGGDSASSKAV